MKKLKVGDRVRFSAPYKRDNGYDKLRYLTVKGIITEVIEMMGPGFCYKIESNGSMHVRERRELIRLVPKKRFKKGDRVTATLIGTITEDPDLTAGDAFVTFDTFHQWVLMKDLKKEE